MTLGLGVAVMLLTLPGVMGLFEQFFAMALGFARTLVAGVP